MLFNRIRNSAILIITSCFSTQIFCQDQLDLFTLNEKSSLYPNAFLILDDSGSMTSLSHNPGKYIQYSISLYLKENTPPSEWPLDWRPYTLGLNDLNYNTEITYTPWEGRSNAPVIETIKELNTFFKDTYKIPFQFNLWTDSAGANPYCTEYISTYCISTYYNFKDGGNGNIDYWDNHLTVQINDDGSFQLDEYKFTGVPSSSGERFSVSITKPLFNHYFKRTPAEEIQNIANWYKYHQTYEKKLKFAAGKLITKYPQFYYGLSFLNHTEIFIPIRATSNLDQDTFNQNLINTVYNLNFDGARTPTLAAVSRVGKYFKNGINVNSKQIPSPLEHPCQANLNFVITDGGYNDYSLINYGDVDGDGTANSLADISRFYFTNDLAPSMADSVPIYASECESVSPVTIQSLRYFFLTLGVTGILKPDANMCWPINTTGLSGNWGFNRLDIAWHAAYNSRGLYKPNENPDEILQDLDGMFDYINKQVIFNQNTTTSSASISAGNLVYTASTNVTNNQGAFSALKKSSTSNNYNQIWEAGDLLSHNINRKILTYNTSNKKGIEVLKTSNADQLANDQKSKLGLQADRIGEVLHSQYLGPILHSDISYAGSNLYQDASNVIKSKNIPGQDTYTNYHNSRKAAKPVIYVGSFDNMLHAFDATSGQELFAYVPSLLLKENMMTQDIRDENRGVDGLHFITDIYSKNRGWKTILVGGLRRGGQGYYALDISDPENFSASDVMWEFNDSQAEDLGLTYARPAVGTFENGATYAVLANGYNNSRSSSQDTHSSSSGHASLYILDIDKGTILAQFKSMKGKADDPSGKGISNGFAEPSLVDSDNDGLVDTIYVGDWFGELYAFNVSGSTPSSWSSYGGSQSGASKPIMSGGIVDNQPITTRPVVTHTQIKEDNKFLTENIVIYGTGQNITRYVPTHSEYLVGVVHKRIESTTSIEKNMLVEKKLALIGSQVVDASSKNSAPTSYFDTQGWFLKIDGELAQYGITRELKILSGELEVILDPKPQNQKNTCSEEADGFYSLVLDPRTGGATTNTVFLDQYNKRAYSDNAPVVGLKNTSNGSSQVVLSTDGKTYNMIVEDGKVNLQERGALNSKDGRQNWRRLY